MAEMGHIETAERILLPMISADKEAATAFAILQLRKGNYSEAYELVKERSSMECGTARIAAKALLALEKAELATNQYRVAIGLCGRESGLQRGLLLARLRNGEEGAIGEGELLVKERPQNTELRRWLIHAMSKNRMNRHIKPHLEALMKQKKATEKELAALNRIQRGLPPGSLTRDNRDATKQDKP